MQSVKAHVVTPSMCSKFLRAAPAVIGVTAFSALVMVPLAALTHEAFAVNADEKYWGLFFTSTIGVLCVCLEIAAIIDPEGFALAFVSGLAQGLSRPRIYVYRPYGYYRWYY